MFNALGLCGEYLLPVRYFRYVPSSALTTMIALAIRQPSWPFSFNTSSLPWTTLMWPPPCGSVSSSACLSTVSGLARDGDIHPDIVGGLADHPRKSQAAVMNRSEHRPLRSRGESLPNSVAPRGVVERIGTITVCGAV